jgi:hypothetical protein
MQNICHGKYIVIALPEDGILNVEDESLDENT